MLSQESKESNSLNCIQRKGKWGKPKWRHTIIKNPRPTKKPHPTRESREEPRLFFSSTHLLVDVLRDQKWKTFNLVFIINIWANCYFLFFKRSLSEKCSNPLLWQLQNGGLTASLDGKHQKKKYWQISGGFLRSMIYVSFPVAEDRGSLNLKVMWNPQPGHQHRDSSWWRKLKLPVLSKMGTAALQTNGAAQEENSIDPTGCSMDRNLSHHSRWHQAGKV